MNPTLTILFMDAQRAERERQAREHRLNPSHARTRLLRGRR